MSVPCTVTALRTDGTGVYIDVAGDGWCGTLYLDALAMGYLRGLERMLFDLLFRTSGVCFEDVLGWLELTGLWMLLWDLTVDRPDWTGLPTRLRIGGFGFEHLYHLIGLSS